MSEEQGELVASAYERAEKTSQTDDLRIAKVAPLPPPEHLIRFFPIAGTSVERLVNSTRERITNILHGADDRLLVVIGPCSIHDADAAIDYARRLKEQRARFADTLEVVMRVYFEKPRTTVGWKGLVNDPYLDQSFRIHEGLRIARQLLLDINRMGVPAASEFLDTIIPQYIADLISWGAIGARTTESQVHRELASACRHQLASRMAPTATCKSPSMQFWQPASLTTFCRSIRTAKWRLSKRTAIKTVT